MNLKGILVAAALISSAVAANSQATNSADVTGTVTDSTGAVVPGVVISVRDVDKGVEHTYTTNNAGLFDTGPIVPDDHYTITFTKEGFAAVQRGPMILHVGRIGMDTQLGVAQTSQQIEVDTAAPLLETATSELSATLPQETLQQLPQIGAPDWQQFIILQPGTQGNASNSSNPGMGGTSANGSLPFSSSLLDGAMENSPQADNVIIIPVFDAIAEVKISDSLFSAQYPSGGILYNQITKGGTNKIHGMAYDYFRNTALNAASYGFGSGRKSPIHFNDYGFNLGGPVLRNRLFLFFDWDHAINHGLSANTFISVPTAAMLQGDFTGLPTVYDPTSNTVNPDGTVTRKSFDSEYHQGNKIPTNLISPVAKAIQAYFPAPNIPNLLVNNYQYQLPSSSTVQKYFGRVDFDLTKNNRITGSAAESLNHTLSNSPVCPINCYSNATSNVTAQLSDYWSISPNTLNEARFGFYAEYDDQRYSSLNQGFPAQLGLKFAKADVFPSINITNIYSFGPGVYFIDKENLFDISDSVTLIRGRHSLHVGGQFVPERVDSNPYSGLSSASLSFNGGYTASTNTATGTPFADFLLGYAKSWSAANYPEYGGRLKNASGFVQDDWKFTPKLTLNLGLRYEGRTGWSEVKGNVRSFDPTVTNPATNTPGAMWYGTTKANGRTALQAPQFSNWYPRVGFAYQLTPRATLRGGFGIYAYQWSALWSAGVGNASGSNGSASDATNNIAPVVTFADDGNTNFQGSKGSSINSLYKSAPNQPEAYNGQNVGFEQYHSSIPLLKEWNLDLQQQLSANMIAEFTYVGSRGTNLPFITDLNQVPENLLGPNDVSSRPYRQYQSITGLTPQGISNYNAAQVTVTRRMSHGLEFSGNYTWSHFLSNQDSSGWNSLQGPQNYQRAYDPGANYGASNFDVRNAAKGQVIYQLPFGKGRMFANKSTMLDETIGGWTLSTTVVVQGGHPFTPTMAVNNSFAQSSNMSWYPNQVANPNRADRGINGWFNSNAYQQPAPYTFGNMRRNSIYGPGMSQINAALHKSFNIFERAKFDFSANATNLPNHASFGQPDAVIGAGHSGTIRQLQVGGRNIELVGKIIF
jgi:hypothetical protein